MAEESAVKVCVRVRPLIPREDSAASENAEPVHYFWKADTKSIYQSDDGNSSKSFSFDRVFTAEETTNQLYQAIAKPLVVSSVQGYNGTIFAYGQTSSGKTFTMMGSDRFPGVLPMAVEDVFQTINSCPKKEFLLRVSYMEIYNETVRDLLVDSWKRKPLEVRETINKTIYVADLTEELVTSHAQVLAWIRKGEQNRHYGKTKMNERSSRSHTIFRMILENRERSDPASGENADGAIIVSHLNLVDLAGSERASQTGAEGARFKEGCNINRSLFTLGQVIKRLTDEGQKGFTNYRDSKLTRILQNSLGGNAKTVIICTITPVSLEETLSTLQFASTAKKMKNDPHVTEVSDEGALLKRYRNEIEDLKRQLQEVSSVTQSTAKEKKSLSQGLQVKDQLQTEQEDRIRNLTKLLVTSSNLVPLQKVPKRRETWGGKMQGLARTSLCDSFTGNRKGDLSCLSELCESGKDFDAPWGIPDEPSDEMDMNQTSVTVRSFADSPKDFVSPARMHELSGRVSFLMMQLEMEAQQKKDALDKLQSTELRAAQLELELQMEAEQKVKALEQVEILGGRLADIGSHNEDQSNTQMKKKFAETIHLCESLSTEMDKVLLERKYLKNELGMFLEQIKILDKEKASLSQELEEKREVDEFKALEDECRKDQENELQNEMANLKKTVEASELQCLDLQNKLQTLTVELKKKTEFALELQSMSGKDLVQEVEKLQRSLGDAEGLSRDTKKEWAVLRSEHMAVEEMNLILSANHEKMEAEVRSLRCELDTEKTRFRKMQSDLQKELNVVFGENTKLTSLLDGKVPQNLIDSMELERRVAQLSRELTVSQEAEGALKAELASFQTLPEKLDSLMKQLDELSEELQSVRAEKETLLSEQSAAAQSSAEEMEKLLSAVTSLTAERDQLQGDLRENVDMTIENQEELRTALEKNRQQRETIKRLENAQTSQQEAPPNETSAQTEELQTLMMENQEELRVSQEKVGVLQDEISALKSQMAELESRASDAEITLQLQELHNQIQTLSEELESVRVERDALLSERTPDTHSEEMETLQCSVTSLSEERDQLQEILEGLRQEKQQLRDQLEDRMEVVAQAQCEFNQPEILTSELHVEEVTNLQKEIKQLQDTLQTVSEQKSLLEVDLQRNMEKVKATETESLLQSLEQQLEEHNQRNIDLETLSLEQQAQLQQQVEETLRGLHSLQEELQEQKQHSSEHLKLCEQKESELDQQIKYLKEQLEGVRAERDAPFVKESSGQSSTEEMEKLQSRVTSLSEDRHQLQETLEGLRQEKQQLRDQLEDRMVMMQCDLQQQLSSEPQSLKEEQEAQQLLQIQQLEEHLEKTKEEGSQLKFDLQENIELMMENQEELRVSQEKVGVLQDEISALKSQKAELESRASDAEITLQLQELHNQIQTLSEEPVSLRAERDALLSEKETSGQSSTEEMEKLQSRVTSLSEDRHQLQETLEGLRQEKQQLRDQLEDRMVMVNTEMATLNMSLQVVIEQKRKLEDDLQQNMTMASTTQELLKTVQEKLCEQQQMNSELDKLCQQKESSLDQQKKTLTEKLESIEAERDALLSEKENSGQSSTEEMEKLQSRVTSLSEDRHQLQETLEGLRQEKQQLRDQLEDRMVMVNTEMATLNMSLQVVIEQKRKLEDDLQQNMTMASTTQELLKTVQEKLCEQQQMNSELDKLCQQKESSLDQQKKTLTEKLESIEAERDALLSEKENSGQSSTEEMEKLQSRVTSLSEDRHQLQETLEGLRQEKQQLGDQLEDRMVMVSATKKMLSEQEQLNSQLREQAERREQETQLQQRLLSDAITTMSVPREQLSSLDQSSSRVKETMTLQLQESTEQLQESFGKFQHFIDACSKYNATGPVTVGCSRLSLTKAAMKTYSCVCLLQQQTAQCLSNTMEHLKLQAQSYMKVFKELVRKDLAVFEERRALDELLCRAKAQSSVKDKDFHSLWDNQLTELLDKRQLYLQKMSSILGKLWACIASYPSELSTDNSDRECFKEKLQSVFSKPMNFILLDSILTTKLVYLSELVHRRRMTLEGIVDEQDSLLGGLKLLEAQAEAQLTEEMSKITCLLVLQLKQTEDKVKALNEQLQEAQVKAGHRVSSHKQATQLLQTELQDSLAQVEEREHAIQTLRSKLRESESKAPPSAVELEKLRSELFKMEVELTSASDKHKQEIQMMNTVLKDKEHSLRKLKETLRKSQQQGEESFLQGEDLHARLTNSRGLVKTKLEEEVKQLRLKITELESLVSSQQAEISKWKSRAFKLKERVQREVVKPSSPSTPTKRGYPMASDCSNFFSSPKKFKVTPRKVLDSPRKVLDSPRKLLDSPKVSALDSPKSRFFDVGGNSELLSRSRPTQFFDNSSLGTTPEFSLVPDHPDTEEGNCCDIILLLWATLRVH
ncbi:centromere-associated protein E isoform X8 [Gymnodraco acuticeps]|uniref:Centromere-associated protein E n=1 Tax=Gymnodraco acuticeps TaxID=8218 RepID=A0A6P8T9S5_GYMAC|nr:centromere-associated protein E isoform X7 [Gymnodraco acuticeps]XP_034060467.1 centromere-associated protein E isoform X8 [Gymnodraco acuticeps]